ncbi:MAG: type II toxin-antitoxin system PemK/MazF family toxin [Candidatus Nanoarchaeia archaeon]
MNKDIYLVEFPFSNISSTKKRPALLVSSLKGENNIFIQISTKEKLTKDYQINLLKSDCEGEIKFDSYINCDMIFTLHKDLIIRKIGSISNKKSKEVENKLLSLFK